ncbi:MAG: glycosyltransferase [Pseudomonadota bacterium]
MPADPLRVLHVIPSLSPLRGGPSAALPPLVRALNDAGCQAGVLTTNDHGPDNRSLPLGRWHDEAGVPVLAFERRRRGIRWFDEHIVCPEAISWLREHHQEWDVLHVHAVFSYLSTQSMRWARRLGKPYLCRPLGQLCHWSLGQRSGRKRLYLKLLERANLEGADAVHFTSRKELEECAEVGLRVRGLVVPHGIEPVPNAGSERSAGPFRLLFLSRLHPKKGIDLLLAALSQIDVPPRGLRLDIAGAGDAPYEAELKARVAALKLASRVHFIGWVDGDRKRELLAQAHLMVLPSHSENFGVAVLESLAHGTPVLLSTEVGLAEEVAGAGAGLVVERDAGALADALKRLLAEPEQLTRMGQNGLALAREHFAWPAVAGALKNIYRKVGNARAA